MEHNHAVILLIDGASGRIVDANQAALRFYGWSRAELCGMNIDQINQLGADAVTAECAAAMDEARNYVVSTHRLAGDALRRVEVHSTPVTIDGVALLISIIHDITERERLADELTRVMRDQAAIIGSPLVGLARVRAGQVVWVNAACADMCGYRVDEMLGQSTRLFFHSDADHAAFGDKLAAVLARGEVFLNDLPLRQRDGSTGWYRVSGVALGGDGPEVLVAVIDISRIKELEHQLRASRQELLDLYVQAPCGYYSLDAQGVFLRANQTELDWLDQCAEALIGRRRITDFFTEPDVERFERRFEAFKAGEALRDMEFDLVVPDRPPRRVAVNAEPVLDEAGGFVMSRSVMFDISALHQTRLALLRLTRDQDAMLDNDMVGMVKLKDRRAVWVNHGMEQLFGYTNDELVQHSARLLYIDDAAFQAFGAVAYAAMAAGGRYRGQTAMRHKDGRTLWVDATGVELAGSPGVSLWLLVDVTASHDHQAQIERVDYHDALTGLPNRLLLADRLIQAMALAERHERSIAVCYLDLDGFKAVNDRLGHAAGDLLLIEIARRLRKVVRVNDTACRIGGDEFVLVLTHLDQVLDHEDVLQRVIATLHQPVALGGGQTAQVSASIGVALFPADGNDADLLLRHADQAMYRAKHDGRGRVCRYVAPHAGAAAAAD